MGALGLPVAFFTKLFTPNRGGGHGPAKKVEVAPVEA